MVSRKLIVVGGFALAAYGLAGAKQPPAGPAGPYPTPVLPANSGQIAPAGSDPSAMQPIPAGSEGPQPVGGVPYVYPTALPHEQAGPARPRPADKKAEPSVEQLLTEVEAIRSQKAELERRERELMAVVRERLEKLRQRIGKLDGAGEMPRAMTPGAPHGGS